MTKVKTILKEFCSAKDILAINRLGLLSKDEERESQPVPWRHRLHRKERRELVRSEMRMSLRPSGRLSTRDKAKAVSEARAPQHSRMGEHLIHINSKGGTTRGGEMSRLSHEQKRTEQQLHQVKRNFLQQSQCLNREPLIVVERPASAKVKSRATVIKKRGIDPDVISMPSYMRPLKCHSRTPSTLTTIEAFTVETRRKKNMWEEAMEDKEDLKFKCTARPSARLTPHEIQQLKVGYTLHKPTQESIAESKLASEKTTRQKSARRPKSSPGDARSTSPVFITELRPKSPTPEEKSAFSAISKSVSFLDKHSENEKPKSQSFPFASSFRYRDNMKPQSAGAATGSRGKKSAAAKSSSMYGREGSVSADAGARGRQGSKSSTLTRSTYRGDSSGKKSLKYETGITDRSFKRKDGKKKDFLAVILDDE
ncbi:uncharacterized protein LOC101861306 [Aplysia californica]|uniref:Uncharacterized protein LOC101861306 n=1 Tax=Aplysia californica TaxID=6500 RepID=A0ABM1A6F5_APLCA|nr:uncharacterized protein LOC101861306 [Aplysia californica]